MLPTHQLGHCDLVTAGLQVQAPQHVCYLAAHFAGVQRVSPQLGQGCARQLQRLALAQAGSHFGLAAGHDDHRACLFLQAEGNGIVGGGVAGMQRGHHINALGQLGRIGGFSHRQIQERHTPKAELLGQCTRFFDQLGARFNAIDMTASQRLEIQVVQDKAQIRLARAMVGQRGAVPVGRHFLQQRLDEIEQVVHLLELAA